MLRDYTQRQYVKIEPESNILANLKLSKGEAIRLHPGTHMFVVEAILESSVYHKKTSAGKIHSEVLLSID